MLRKPSTAILDHAREICVGLQVDDGTSYWPSNSTEGCIFEDLWCNRCKLYEDCSIFTKAFCGDQPEEWHYWNGAPLCSAWRDKQDKHPLSRPRKPRSPQTTPLLDWMEAQPLQADNGAAWIDRLLTVSPEPPQTESPDSPFKVGDWVTCKPTGTGRQPWLGWVGEVIDIDRDRAFIRFDEYPLYSVQLSQLSSALSSVLSCDDNDPDPWVQTSALKEWRQWNEGWTYTGFMGIGISSRFANGKVFPVSVNPNDQRNASNKTEIRDRG